jgi:hypothetical protein
MKIKILLYAIFFSPIVFQQMAYSLSFKTYFDYKIIPTSINYDDNLQINTIITKTTSVINSSIKVNLSDDESKFLIGPIFELSRNEDYSQAVTFGIQLGYGNLYENKFIMGLSGSYLQDLRIRNTLRYSINSFIYIGEQEFTHLNIINNGGLLALILIPATDSNNTIEIELAIGYKKFLPIYFLGNIKATNLISSISDNQYIKYFTKNSIYHLIYYGNDFNISFGYTDYEHGYYLTENDKTGYYLTKISTYTEAKYYGFGCTFKKKNLLALNNNVYLEYHILKNENKLLNIGKIGFEYIF